MEIKIPVEAVANCQIPKKKKWSIETLTARIVGHMLSLFPNVPVGITLKKKNGLLVM